MKFFLTIFLICYFSLSALVPRMDFDRLTQIPDLAAHLLEHESPDTNLDISDFINSHYEDDNEHHNDEHELPFQKHNCSVISYSFASFWGTANDFAAELSTLAFSPSYNFHFTTPFLSNIWQPPRV